MACALSRSSAWPLGIGGVEKQVSLLPLLLVCLLSVMA